MTPMVAPPPIKPINEHIESATRSNAKNHGQTFWEGYAAPPPHAIHGSPPAWGARTEWSSCSSRRVKLLGGATAEPVVSVVVERVQCVPRPEKTRCLVRWQPLWPSLHLLDGLSGRYSQCELCWIFLLLLPLCHLAIEQMHHKSVADALILILEVVAMSDCVVELAGELLNCLFWAVNALIKQSPLVEDIRHRMEVGFPGAWPHRRTFPGRPHPRTAVGWREIQLWIPYIRGVLRPGPALPWRSAPGRCQAVARESLFPRRPRVGKGEIIVGRRWKLRHVEQATLLTPCYVGSLAKHNASRV